MADAEDFSPLLRTEHTRELGGGVRDLFEVVGKRFPLGAGSICEAMSKTVVRDEVSVEHPAILNHAPQSSLKVLEFFSPRTQLASSSHAARVSAITKRTWVSPMPTRSSLYSEG
jgi:hypothetical protein